MEVTFHVTVQKLGHILWQLVDIIPHYTELSYRYTKFHVYIQSGPNVYTQNKSLIIDRNNWKSSNWQLKRIIITLYDNVHYKICVD